MRTLHTEFLILLPQTAAHAAAMYEVLCDPALYEFENQPPESEAWLRQRYAKLETRLSPDGTEQWLNWVVQTPDAALIGYVQATVCLRRSTAWVAYEFNSRHWGRGHAQHAVRAMMLELAEHYGVHHFEAVFKKRNQRSQRLLERLGFSPAPPERQMPPVIEPDECLMLCTGAAVGHSGLAC